VSGWAFWAGAGAAPLLLTELGGWAPWLAERLVRRAARRLGDPAAARYAEEFAAAVARIPGKISRLAAAVGILACTPLLRRALTGARPADRPAPPAAATSPPESPLEPADILLPAPPPADGYRLRLELILTPSGRGRPR
jgi:hypothetical protein